MKALIDRFTDTIQREHDLIAELRELGSKYMESIDRMQAHANRLQAAFDRSKVVHLPKVEPSDDFTVPNALKGGPTKRD